MFSPSVTLQPSTGKRRKTLWVLSLVLNDRKHFDDVTSLMANCSKFLLLTPGGNNFNDFSENQMSTFHSF